MSTLTAREWKTALVLSLLSWAVLPTVSPAQPDREVIVMFRPGVVNLPAGVDSGTVEEASLGSEPVYNILAEYGIESIRRGMPGFDPSPAFFVNAPGDTVWRPAFSRVYALRCPENADRDAIIENLNASPDVVYAEPNGTCVVFDVPYPNDPELKQGRQWAIWRPATSSPDSGTGIGLPEAWLKTTGNPDNRVLIIDEGFDDSHPDLADRVGEREVGSGLGDHAFQVAGIIGATTDNGLGISGIDWRARLDSKYGPPVRDVPALAATEWPASRPPRRELLRWDRSLPLCISECERQRSTRSRSTAGLEAATRIRRDCPEGARSGRPLSSFGGETRV